jgi:DnaJ domain
MDLPGRLRATTLGDLLGALHRARVNGTLELAEDRGRLHRVHLAQGLVAAVELDAASPSLAEILRNDHAADDDVLRRSLLRAMASQRLHGEVLVDDFRLSPEVVGNALRRQVLARLAVLDKLPDARVSFRVAVRVPRGALTGRLTPSSTRTPWDPPLAPHEFLHGRRRLRERGGEARGPTPPPALHSPEQSSWRVLGLPPGAQVDEIKRAYRRLARTVHPDLHPGASDEERRALQARFVEITDAYRTLVA